MSNERHQRVDPKLLIAFAEESAITPRNFALYHSGKKGYSFIDIDNIVADLNYSKILIDEIIDMIEESTVGFDKIAFLDKDYGPVGLLPLCSQIASGLEKDVTFIKLYDTLRLNYLKYSGNDIVGNKNYLLLDDIATTGRTQERAVDIIRNEGGSVNSVYCVVERRITGDPFQNLKNEGIECKSLLTEDQLRFTGLIMGGSDEEYLQEDFIKNFVEIQERGEQIYNVEEIENRFDHIIDSIIDESGVQVEEDVKKGLRNIYFHMYTNLTQGKGFSALMQEDEP